MTNTLKNNNGFSLIELMVVVAIIGILSAIGIPQYAKFQAKARQSEAKTSLAALFTGESSFQSEWTCYTMNPSLAGFGLTGGSLRYQVGFPGLTPPSTGYNPNAPIEAAGVKLVADYTGSAFAATPPGIAGTYAPPVAAAAVSSTGTTFKAIAWGSPNSGATACAAGSTVGTMCDTWNIDQLKNLSNTQSGIW